jgi:hypothetical protein
MPAALLDARYPVAIAREVPHFPQGWPHMRLAQGKDLIRNARRSRP